MSKESKIEGLVWESMIGKTIKSVDHSAANTKTIEFTDGSKISLDTQHVGYGIYGIVPMLADPK